MKKTYYMIDDLEIKFFDVDGNDNELTDKGIDIEDLKEYEDFVNNLKKRELEKVKNKFPNYEFIDEDEE